MMTVKTIVKIAACFVLFTNAAMGAGSVAKVSTTPSDPEGLLTVEQIPPLTTTVENNVPMPPKTSAQPPLPTAP